MSSQLIHQITATETAAPAEWSSFFKTHLHPGMQVGFSGPLGAGKTALIRGLLTEWGVRERIKSPTYSLVESYTLPSFYSDPSLTLTLHHFDLYRLESPEELYYLGLDTYFTRDALCFIEWPEKGQGVLPPLSYTLKITPVPHARHYALFSHLPSDLSR
jgi:tRNA threonylcarbamoyladenosine biosynthesis protein TsaE